MNKLFYSILAASALIIGNSANAALFLSFGDGSMSSNNPLTGVSAEVELAFSDFAAGQVQVTATVKNTTGINTVNGGFNTNGDPISPADTASSSKLTAFALDLYDPNTGIASFTAGTYLDTQVLDGSISPFGTIEFAAADDNNINGGNANGALPEGITDTFSFVLNTTDDAATVEAGYLANFLTGASGDVFGTPDGSYQAFTRYQQVEPGGRSDKLMLASVNNTGFPTQTQAIPEPSTYAMFGLAFGMLGFVGYRRSRKS